MHATPKQSAFETKVLAMENGFNNFPVPNADLAFGKEILAPKDVVQRLGGYVALIQDVETTREAHEAAVRACEKAMPAAHAFYEEAIVVVKAHFGSDPKVMATFGLGAPRKHAKALPVMVIEEVIMPQREDASARRAFASPAARDSEVEPVIEEVAAEEAESDDPMPAVDFEPNRFPRPEDRLGASQAKGRRRTKRQKPARPADSRSRPAVKSPAPKGRRR